MAFFQKIYMLKKYSLMVNPKNINLVTKIPFDADNRCSVRKGVLRNFSKFTGKHLCHSLCFNKVANLSPATLLTERLWHRCFPVNFEKFLRTPFLQNTSGCCFWKNVNITLRDHNRRVSVGKILWKHKKCAGFKKYYKIVNKTFNHLPGYN